MKKTRRNVDSEWNENDVTILDAVDDSQFFLKQAYHSTYIVEACVRGVVKNIENNGVDLKSSLVREVVDVNGRVVKDVKTFDQYSKFILSELESVRKDIERNMKLIQKHIALLPYHIFCNGLDKLQCGDVSKQIANVEMDSIVDDVREYADEIEEMNKNNADKLLNYDNFAKNDCVEEEKPNYSYADIAQTILSINAIQLQAFSFIDEGINKIKNSMVEENFNK